MLVQKKGKLKSIRKWKNNWYVLNLIFHPSSFTDTTLISTSCTVLDQILDYMFERLTRPADVSLAMCREPEGDKWKSALEQDPDVLYEVFWIVLFIKYGHISSCWLPFSPNCFLRRSNANGPCPDLCWAWSFWTCKVDAMMHAKVNSSINSLHNFNPLSNRFKFKQIPF